MKFHRYLDREAVAAAFEDLGFATPDEATGFRSVDRLHRHLLERSGGDSTGPEFRELPQRFMKAGHLARKVEGAGRDLVGLHDPATATLRHVSAPASRSPLGGGVLDDEAVRYVRPDSIQSSQSPAAYLAWLYQLAKAEITPEQPPFELDRRRPDLKDLALSRENLDLEITTLRLANEVLAAQLIDNGIAEDEAALIEALKTIRHPFAMPFDRDNATVREALAAMGDLSLNAIAERGRGDAFAPGVGDWTLVANPADRVRLYGEHVKMLGERPDAETLYGAWFGLPDTGSANEELQFADAFAAAAGLSFQEFQALVGDDATVVDEAGRVHRSMFYRFMGNGWYLELAEQEDGRYRTQGYTGGESSRRDLPWHVHEMQNKCVRLQRRTGLAFHWLDWLLLTAVYGHPSYDFDDDRGGGENSIQHEVLSDGTGLDLLARHAEWAARHGVGVERFAALVGDINCLRREGSGETSLMGELFGADAPEIALKTRRWAQDHEVQIGEVDGDGPEGHLGAVLRRGFRLSRAEWDLVVSEVSGSPKDVLDSAMMGRIHRLSYLFGLMGWSVAEGIELVRKVDAALLATLARSRICGDVLTALDRVSWLAAWMREAEFTPAEAMTLLTAPKDAVLYPNRDILNWVFELQQGVAGALVAEPDFIPYTDWFDGSGDAVTIGADAWVAELKEAKVLDDGDRGLMVTGERDALAAAVTGVLTNNEVDLDDPGQAERADELVSRLAARHGEQGSILASHVARQGDGLYEAAVPGLLRWMGNGAYEALTVLVDWDTDEDPANEAGLRLLFDLHRHALVVGRIGMDVPEVELAADSPSWIAAGMEAPLTLKQVHLLLRFKGLQDAQASANDWLAYFAKVAADDGDAGQSENHDRLGRLLDWPGGEIALLAVGPGIGIDDGRIATVEQADFVARRVALCREAGLGAAELIALEGANGEEPDWPAARAAALIGLGRFEDGAHAARAEGLVDEEHRDALVALWLTRVAAADGVLKERIATDENLYEYLLLDVKVSREVPATRLLEATGSVQLYINRALENVESAEFVDRAGFARVWETGRQYRLWEANEKLALYPSNFIEPELRQGKTELFRDFERLLSQGEIDGDGVEAAVHGYVGGLQRVSELRPHGFFFTRNMSRTTYYFTARADWEKHGYYYRRLEIDRLRLVDGSPHAFRWDDWKKAQLPVAAEHVYGVVPAFAWNRLFLFWFEMEEEVVTDADGGTTTRYRLKPKYSRQNLDGSFTDPWAPDLAGADPEAPDLAGADLEVTDLVGPDGPGAYRPLIYQPYFETLPNQIALFFATNPDNLADESRRFVWRLSGSSSRNEIRTTSLVLAKPHTLAREVGEPIYASIPHSLSNVEHPGVGIEPGEHGVVGVSLVPGGGDLLNTFLVMTHLRWTLALSGERRGDMVYRWSASEVVYQDINGIGLAGAYAIVKINGVEAARHRIVDEQPPGHAGEVDFAPVDASLAFDPDTPEAGVVEVIVEAEFGIPGDALDEPRTDRFGHVSAYVLLEDYASHLFFGTDEEEREAEHYLLSEDRNVGTVAAGLFSTGMQEIAGGVYPGHDLDALFSLNRQQPEETGVGNFLEMVEASEEPHYGEVQKPRPLSRLDFDGPFGLYAWELFFHAPLSIAARYGAAGKYEEARLWLHAIYNPQAEAGDEWGVWPLLPRNEGVSYAIADPDRIAVEQPAHYRLATMRHYLRTMTGQGDAHYRQGTAESLRLAKMWYVSAKSLFLDQAGDAFERSTREDWDNPALGAVGEGDFRPPYNEEMRSAWTVLEARLDNLRHWRSIDGEPLNLPLVAAPVSPRALQAAALSGAPASEAAASSQAALPFDFEAAMAKAREAVESLMYFGDLLTRGLYRQDELALEELHAGQALHIACNLEEAGQESLIESMVRGRTVLEKERDEANKYLEWRDRFAGEFMNSEETGAHALLGIKGATLGLATMQTSIAAGLGLFPTIFGLSFGGAEPKSVPEAAAFALDNLAETYGTTAEALMHRGEVVRRQQENRMEQAATEKVVERITAEIARLDYDIGEERGTLVQLGVKTANAQALAAFHLRRVTNREFRNWYAGRIASLYDSAYDLTLRFCRLAEQAYRVEVGDWAATFIRPAWDAQHRGLLAGQSLLLDLQRMDFAHMERYRPEAQGALTVRLSEVDAVALEGVRQTGRGVFTLGEALFDEAMPDEYARRIASLRVELRWTGEEAATGGRLALIGHRTFLDRGKSEAGSLLNVFGRQQITLAGADTDTARMSARGGRLLPFERCGVGSTWLLAFPAAARDIEARRPRSPHRAALETLEDVILEIRYTART